MTAVEFTIPGQNRYRVTGEVTARKDIGTHPGHPGRRARKKGTAPYSTDGQVLSAGGPKIDLDQVLLPMALCADARLMARP